MPLESSPGLYGKVPILGDFVTRRLPARFVQIWDTWLQEALSISRQQLGAEWLESYLYSPIWRFILGPGNCGPTASWAGVLMPSVDKVGRYFPLTLAVSINEQNALPSLFVTAADWFHKLEQLALSALDEAFNFDDFDRTLQAQVLDVPIPTSGMTSVRDDLARANGKLAFRLEMDRPEQISDAIMQLSTALAGLLAQFLPTYSLWTTNGSERLQPSWLVYDGLPPSTMYSTLLTRQWRQDGAYDQAPVSYSFPDLDGQGTAAARQLTGERSTHRLLWRSCARSTVGKLRKINEDAYLERPEVGLWAVADGMGGHQAGEVASQAIVRALVSMPDSDTLETLTANVIACLQKANADLVTMASTMGAGQIIGSTVVVMLAVGHRCTSLWVGDSRLYRYRDGILSQLTHDHSLAAERFRQGLDTEEESVNNAYRHMITRALGVKAELSLDIITYEAKEGDVYLLCSDGLVNEMSSQEIATILRQGECHESAQRLIDLALVRGARDNVTVVVVRTDRNSLD